MQIDIDFEVFKALTLRRETEAVSYNDVIRQLLGLPAPAAGTGEATPTSGYTAAGRFLPNGTALRVRYKGEHYTAEIADGRIRHETGRTSLSLSAAAKKITKNNVNGLRFWEAKRPGDLTWSKVVELPKNAS
jgi:hypothetical protein